MGDKITVDEAMLLVRKIADEVGLTVDQTSGFWKIVGPNSHLIYIQKSKKLGTINTTLPLPAGEPGTKGLQKPNGSITCHIEPELVHLERFLRMLADKEVGKFEVRHPKPFAATKAPEPRRPKAVVPAVPMSEIRAELEKHVTPEGRRSLDLQARIDMIHEGVRRARYRRYQEEGFDDELSELLADKEISLEEAWQRRKAAEAPTVASTVEEVAREAGIEGMVDG